MRTLMEMTHESRGNHTDTQSSRDTGGGTKAQSIVAVFALPTFELLLILPSVKAGNSTKHLQYFMKRNCARVGRQPSLFQSRENAVTELYMR